MKANTEIERADKARQEALEQVRDEVRGARALISHTCPEAEGTRRALDAQTKVHPVGALHFLCLGVQAKNAVEADLVAAKSRMDDASKRIAAAEVRQGLAEGQRAMKSFTHVAVQLAESRASEARVAAEKAQEIARSCAEQAQALAEVGCVLRVRLADECGVRLQRRNLKHWPRSCLRRWSSRMPRCWHSMAHGSLSLALLVCQAAEAEQTASGYLKQLKELQEENEMVTAALAQTEVHLPPHRV